MSEQSGFLVRRVVQIQVPPEVEQAAHAADVAALPPETQQNPARDAIFAVPHDPLAEGPRAALDPAQQTTKEENQAEAAMVLLFAQQLVLTHAKQERRVSEKQETPRRKREEDAEDA